MTELAIRGALDLIAQSGGGVVESRRKNGVTSIEVPARS
jgi:hypothetical protein